MYTINAAFGFNDFVTYQDDEVHASVNGNGLFIRRRAGGTDSTNWLEVLTDDAEGRLDAIERAVEAGVLSEPAASCLSMLVEEPWLHTDPAAPAGMDQRIIDRARNCPDAGVEHTALIDMVKDLPSRMDREQFVNLTMVSLGFQRVRVRVPYTNTHILMWRKPDAQGGAS